MVRQSLHLLQQEIRVSAFSYKFSIVQYLKIGKPAHRGKTDFTKKSQNMMHSARLLKTPFNFRSIPFNAREAVT